MRNDHAVGIERKLRLRCRDAHERRVQAECFVYRWGVGPSVEYFFSRAHAAEIISLGGFVHLTNLPFVIGHRCLDAVGGRLRRRVSVSVASSLSVASQ